MTVRALAAFVTLVAGLIAVGLVTEDPEILRAVAGKLTEGGMWTALAVFIAAAAVLAYRRRGFSGRPPPDHR